MCSSSGATDSRSNTVLSYTPQEYVSVLSTSYCYPIAALLEKLEVLERNQPNEVKASTPENGFSVAIIVLAVLLLESAIGRTQFVKNIPVPDKPIAFVTSAFPLSGFSSKIEELFVVRDAIAHNHLWEAQFEWDDQLGMKFVTPPTQRSGGDNKFNRVLDPTNRKTRLLGINLFPTRICREDVIIVLHTAIQFLKFLEQEDRNYVIISTVDVKIFGKITTFVDLITGLKP